MKSKQTKRSRPPEGLVLNRLAQLKALADTVRYRIFEQLTIAPRTAKQVAEQFGMKPTRLYHHFRVLEEAGLIHKVKTRKVRGTVEKYYEAVAQKVTLDPNILGDKVVGFRSLFAAAFQSTLEEVVDLERRAAETGAEPEIVLNRLRIRTTPEKALKLQAKLAEWVARCEAASTESGTVDYGVTVAFYRLMDQKSEIHHEA